MLKNKTPLYLVAAVFAAMLLSGASSAQSAAGAGVQASEGQITLPTYTWYDDANPVFDSLESGIYYPYTRQDLLGIEKVDRTYRAVFLENEYLKVTCLPELGGRIHSVLDKTTNEEMYHKNDVIKPALIAMRGAWISGGIEWNPGPHGHTVTIVSPVDVTSVKNDDGSASLVIANVEKMFRTRWSVRLTLHPGKAYLDEEIAIYNPNDAINPYYFWNCTAFPNLPGTRFIYPMTLGCDHAGTSFFSWPMHEGKDITWLKNYPTMSSVFAFECPFDFFGAYDVDRNRGIVSYADHDKLPGKKAWTWGKDDFGVTSEMKLSDAGPVHSQYIEVQSGPLLTQADYGMLKPGESVTWSEYWYPVHGLGDGFEFATREACVNVKYAGLAIDIDILATAVYPGARVTVVAAGDEMLADQQADLSPLAPARVAVQDAPGGPVTITVTAADNQQLLRYVSPLQIPKVEPPDLTKKPARPDGLPTPDELYAEAWLLDSQTNPAGAYAAYEKVIEADPGHVPALCGMAVIEIEQAQYDKAEEHARKAIDRDREYGWPWYLLAVTHLRRAHYDDALYAANKAMLSKDAQALGYGVAGRAYAALGKLDEAETLLARAVKINPDARNRARLLAVQAAKGGNLELAAQMAVADPVDWIYRAIADSRGNEKYRWAVLKMLATSGEPEFNALNVASFFAELSLYDESFAWLQMYLNEASAAGAKPSLYAQYALAYYAARSGDKTAAAPSDASADFAFPHGPDALDVMSYVVTANPNDASAYLLLGYVYAGLNRLNEALPQWQKAVELNPRLSTAMRLLGLHEWKVAKRLDEAEKWYRKAIDAQPADQILYRDLCQILGEANRRADGIQLAQTAPRTPAPRYDLILWLANAYVAEHRYDDCISLLSTERFSNWEGSSKPRDVFVSALMARGKAAFDAGQTESALADFQAALEYPENLGVGVRYARTDAEVQFWLGRALATLGRYDEARAAWQNGASQHTSKAKPLPMISVPAGQDEYAQRCQTALDLADVARKAPAN